jgi:hypothetical protein
MGRQLVFVGTLPSRKGIIGYFLRVSVETGTNRRDVKYVL